MNDYAKAINQAIHEGHMQWKMYGRLLAQAGIYIGDVIEEVPESCRKLVGKGYNEQLRDYPNG